MSGILNRLTDKTLGKIAIGAGVVSALAVAVFLSGMWRHNEFQSQPVYVVVAARNITPQMEILPGDLMLKSIPRRYVPPDAIQQISSAVGRIAATAIPEGTVLTLATTMKSTAQSGIAGSLPPGMRAVAIAVDEVNGVAGLVRPGNFVDCLLTVDFGDDSGSRFTTLTLLEQVPVVAINQNIFPPTVYPSSEKGKKSEKSDGLSRQVVTVAVSPEAAATLMLAQESGRVHLTLRPQDETGTVSVAPVTLDRITQAQGVVRPRSRPSYLEYRGGR